jgi:hypothetical protein
MNPSHRHPPRFPSVLSMPAWLRVLWVLPLLALLWLGVWWASASPPPL